MSDTAPTLPAVGSIPPDFSLRDHFGADAVLSEFADRSPVALVFFPLAFTNVCAGELCELRDRLGLFEAAGVEVFGISVDPVATLRAFADAESIPFRLLSDFWPHGEVATRYGAFDPARGTALRATVLVNNSGRVASTFWSPRGEPRDLATYEKALATL
ncbi:peroxiredoxin [Microcella putealis]|uniref:Peroxiredoxin n=1 Tax=Microcella putealis TaxID=337005 RepID=A0A4Q7LWY5_9MICO|nr:peroxiredoxin [Microcella putealis]RZS58997.1 peroxiredoxin [Microcella putealis]TQM24023.1 peroxiredoxin [Microcella putealis]